DQRVGAPRQPAVGRALQHGHRLTGQHEPGGAFAVDSDAPGGRRLVGVGRADDAQLRRRPHLGQLLDGLVRRTVLTEADGVVRPAVHDLGVAQRRQPDGGPHVVAEVEERAAEGDATTVQGDAVQDRAHGVLADAEVDEAAAGLVEALHARVLDVGARVACQVGTATDQAGYDVAHGVDAFLVGLAGGELVARLPRGELGLPAVETAAFQTCLELGAVALPGL